jgi:dihydrofolate synthase / folylpolyglutamate synthase
VTPRTLAQWLAYQMHVHPRDIALGLDRVREVAARMALARPAPLCITIAGTNGKGSTVAFLEAMLRGAGHRVGAFTSPHLLRYNERVRIDGVDIDDDALIGSFARIESARAEIPLTYFEFGTLAAFDCFARANVDVALLEVGLGGRLDAVNLVDADAAIVTTVDLDHQDWLGPDRDAIGREKAGVFRRDRPAIVGDADPPAGLLDAAHECGASLQRLDHEFGTDAVGDGFVWTHRDGTRYALPAPMLAAPSQPRNAASAIAALHALRHRIAVSAEAFASGVANAQATGRLQRIATQPLVLVDVAHNAQAARELAAALSRESRVLTIAVFSALADKDVETIVAALAGRVAAWHLFGLDQESPRGLSADALAARVRNATPTDVTTHADYRSALRVARDEAGEAGRVIVFGSFFTVAAALSETQSLRSGR